MWNHREDLFPTNAAKSDTIAQITTQAKNNKLPAKHIRYNNAIISIIANINNRIVIGMWDSRNSFVVIWEIELLYKPSKETMGIPYLFFWAPVIIHFPLESRI